MKEITKILPLNEAAKLQTAEEVKFNMVGSVLESWLDAEIETNTKQYEKGFYQRISRVD